MYGDKRKEKIKINIAIAIIVLILAIAFVTMIKYSVEGETNMPFKLSKITIVSTAEGIERAGNGEKWNLSIFQNNDIYFNIEKNVEYKKEEIIESISIENIQITKTPQKGEIKTYMPNSSEGRTFTYAEEYIIKENKLTYKGATKTNTRTLEIGNQGGTPIIRFSNVGIGEYISNEEEEIKHDGSLIAKTETTKEQLEFNVSFDLVISLKNKKYKSNININLPCGNLIEEGTSNIELDGKQYIFKRINN